MPLPVILVFSGVVGGYIAGLIGVGGGIIFSPVLFFCYESVGMSDQVVAPLTIGTSLFCAWITASASAWFQYRRGAVHGRVALGAGLASAGAIFVTSRFVTTQPWYSAHAFQMVFSVVLIAVVIGMLRGRKVQRRDELTESTPDPSVSPPWVVGTGTAAGLIAAAVGIGGGLLLVPVYHQLFGYRLRRAVGTSSATIMVVTLVGVTTYVILGWGNAQVPATAWGYVDVGRALFLALPAVPFARLGVWTAHTINTRLLRGGFALVAVLVAARLLWRALT